MQNGIFSKLSRESIIQVFNCICKSDRISIKDISSITELSVMTVGKIINGLNNAGVLKISKQLDSTPGRKAKLISPNERYYTIVIDLTSKEFSISLLNLSCGLREKITEIWSSDLFLDDRLTDFFEKSAKFINKKYGMSKCIGIGLIFDGKYDKSVDRIFCSAIPQISSVRICEIITKIFRITNVIPVSCIYSAAYKANDNNETHARSLYLRLDSHDINGTLIYKKEPTCDPLGDSFTYGDFIIDSLSIRNRLSMAKSLEEEAELIVNIISKFRIIYNFSNIYCEILKYKSSGAFMKLIQNSINSKYSEISDCAFKLYPKEKVSLSSIYVLEYMRNIFINRIIDKNASL